MKRSPDPLGELLVMAGVLTEEELTDVLEQQRLGLPFASHCLVLGYADEATLVRALSRQMGVPGVVLGQCIVSLQNLRGIPASVARRYGMLPLYEDRQQVFVALSDLSDQGVVNQLAIIKGKSVIPHVAVAASLHSAIRSCYRLMEAGDAYWFGADTSLEMLNDPGGVFTPVLDVDELPEGVSPSPLDVTDPNMPMPVDPEDILEAESLRGASGLGFAMPEPAAGDAGEEEEGELDLDLEARVVPAEGLLILLVDPEERSRGRLSRLLEQDGHQVVPCGSAIEAVRLLRADPPDLAIMELMLPQIQGYQLCRRIKSSGRYGHIPVILMARTDPEDLHDHELLSQYRADEVLARPIGLEELRVAVAAAAAASGGQARRGEREVDDHELFQEGISLYRDGRAEEAVSALRSALEEDPLSARYHFVLGNILQSQDRRYEAIDAYESTLSLRPDYFPALSRLAYLYYKQGFLKRAFDTWGLSLEHCPDEAQKERIQRFRTRLGAELHRRKVT